MKNYSLKPQNDNNTPNGWQTLPRICMFIPSYYPLVGGAERQAQQLSKMLIGKGVDVFVLTRRIKGTNPRENVDDVPVYRTYAPNSVLFLFSSLIFLIKHRNEYDIIHVHTPDSPAITAIIVSLFLNKKIIVKIRGTGKGSFFDRISNSFFRQISWVFRRVVVDCWVAINKEAVGQLLQFGISRRKIVEIPNGVDTQLFHPIPPERKFELRKNLPFPTDHLLCLFVGRLIKSKRVDLLIESWVEIINNFPQLHLLIIGGGNEETNLKNLVKKHNLSSTISFTGEISPNEVLTYLQMGNLFILPSEREGISNALLEAMSTGLPIIATKIAGNEEVVVEGKNGFLIEPGNRKELSDAILKLAKDDVLLQSAGQQSRFIIETAFSLEVIANKYIRTYKRLLGGTNDNE